MVYADKNREGSGYVLDLSKMSVHQTRLNLLRRGGEIMANWQMIYELKQARGILGFIPVDERPRLIARLRQAKEAGGNLNDLLYVLIEDEGNGRSWEKP